MGEEHTHTPVNPALYLQLEKSTHIPSTIPTTGEEHTHTLVNSALPTAGEEHTHTPVNPALPTAGDIRSYNYHSKKKPCFHDNSYQEM